MDEWNNIPLMYHDWVPIVGLVLLGIALVASVVWFIDGVKKYWYDK